MKKTFLKSFLAGFLSLALVLTPPLGAVVGLTVLSGCAQVLPGQDVLVVRAEQTAAGAFEIMDAFVEMEEANREKLRQLAPEIERAANKIRRDGRKALEELRNVTRVYKQNRTAENKASLITWMAVVTDLQRIAQEHLAQAKTAGVL